MKKVFVMDVKITNYIFIYATVNFSPPVLTFFMLLLFLVAVVSVYECLVYIVLFCFIFIAVFSLSLFSLFFFSSPNNPPSHHPIFLGCNIKSALYFTHVRTHTEWETERDVCNTQTTGEHLIFIRFVSLCFFWLLFLLSASVFVSRAISWVFYCIFGRQSMLFH